MQFVPNQTIFLWLNKIIDELKEADTWMGEKVFNESENLTILGFS